MRLIGSVGLILSLWSLGIAAAADGRRTANPAKPVFLYGSLSDRPTYDTVAGGGNPFAAALVEALAAKSASFATFTADLVELTAKRSRGLQQAEVIGGKHLSQWQVLPRSNDEKSIALVVVFSEYDGTPHGRSLPGAKRDACRVAQALWKAGFAVTRLIDPDRTTLEQTIDDFANRTSHADVALIYTTGHGVETDGTARVLVPYKRAGGSNDLAVTELANATRARQANLIFYAACRTRR
jgi:Caspase domain